MNYVLVGIAIELFALVVVLTRSGLWLMRIAEALERRNKAMGVR